MTESNDTLTTPETQEPPAAPQLPTGQYLDNDDVLIVNRTLAQAYGLQHSIVLRQVHYWLRLFAKTKSKKHFMDGRWWMYNSYRNWRNDNFDFWSERTIRRTLDELVDLGILLSSDKYNTDRRNRSKWYTVNYGAHEAYMRLWRQHGSPLHHGGKKFPQRLAFIEDWNEQRKVPEVWTSWTGGVDKLAMPCGQVGQSLSLEIAPQTTTETNEKKIPLAAEAAASRLPKEKKPRPRNVLFDAVATHIFALDPMTLDKTSGGRIAKIVAWLKQNATDATPEQVQAFAKHHGQYTPRDVTKFGETWLRWRANGETNRDPRAITQGTATNPLAGMKVLN